MVRTSPRLQLAATMAEQRQRLRRREGDVAIGSAASGFDAADSPAGGAGGLAHEQNACARGTMVAAERDVAAALQDLEVVTLAAAAAGARACSRAKAPKKPSKSQNVGPMAQGSDDPMSESSSDSSEDEGDDVELRRRLVKCRSERAAALEALERVDGLVQGLLDRTTRCCDGHVRTRRQIKWIGTSSRGGPRGIEMRTPRRRPSAAPKRPSASWTTRAPRGARSRSRATRG